MTRVRLQSCLRPFGLTLSILLALAPVPGQAQVRDPGNATDAVNPHSPRANAPYRRGVVATREQHEKMRSWAQSNAPAHPGVSSGKLTGQEAATAARLAATSAQTLSFQGGVNGIGVTSGVPKVYLVFWGSQWGSQATDANGNLTFTGDPKGAAPYMQKWLKGLGTNGELWSGTMTQYCDGPLVPVGATSCPAGAPHVGYPTGGGVLAGVWYDNSAAAPSAATGKQIAAEAVKAAGYFGNTTPASNRYAQYIIMSPTGLNPDNWKTGGFCAWHDYNGDTTLSGGGAAPSSYGDIAFTNMPYVADQGASCGAGFVTADTTYSALQGFSLVGGHEYAETVTDQNPAGGWINTTGSSYNGQENADECSWIKTGQGAAGLIAMATGSFAMQGSWSNDTGRCDLTHPIVTGSGGGTPTANFTATTTGLTATFTDKSTDSGGTIASWSWNFGDGTPISLLQSPSHTYAAAGTYNVSETVTDSVNGKSSTKTLAVTVTAPVGGGTPTANFTSSVSGATATFTDTSTDSGGTIGTWAWNFGDGTSSNLKSPSHTYAASGTYTVTETVTDSVSAKTSTKTASVTVSVPGSGIVTNGGFETTTGWTATAGVLCTNTTCTGQTARSGSGFVWLDGYGVSHTDTVAQSIVVPSGVSKATLSFYLHIDTRETTKTKQYDKLTVTVKNGTVTSTLATYSNLDAATGYALKSISLTPYIGKTITLTFTGTEDSTLATSFVLDDVSVVTQ